MDGISQSLANMPWYAWVAIVVMVCGTVVKVAGAKKNPHG